MKIPALSKSFQIWMDRMQELNKGGPSMAEKLSDSKVSHRLELETSWGLANGSKIPVTPKVADFSKTISWSFWLVHSL